METYMYVDHVKGSIQRFTHVLFLNESPHHKLEVVRLKELGSLDVWRV